MGFGIFKKIKDAFKKAKTWVQKVVPKARDAVNKVTPFVKNVLDVMPQNDKISKAKDILNLTNQGLGVADDAINKGNYKDAIDWTKANIVPRIKH